MRKRIVVQIDDVGQPVVERLVDGIYDMLCGRGLDYSVWVEPYTRERPAAGETHLDDQMVAERTR